MDDWRYQPARDHGLGVSDQNRSVHRESGLLGKLSQSLWWAWVSAHLHLLERLEVTGRQHLPAEPPFVLVANHASHMDALILATLLPPHLRTCTFPVAAGDTFFETPVRAALSANLLNALPLWRQHAGRHAIADLRDRLCNQPCGLILFPEGTRSRTGEMGRFKPGLGMLVAGRPVPVVPCLLTGTAEAWPAGRRLPRPGCAITAALGPPLRFDAVPDARDGWAHVATATEQAVAGLA